MKTCYVGVGGIGCRALKQLYWQALGRSDLRFLYFDSDKSAVDDYDETDSFYLFADYPYGTGCLRDLGKDMFRKFLYTGQIPDFIDDFFVTEELLLCLVTTTFGGFGSAVVMELADYLSARIKVKYPAAQVSVRVIAFTHEVYRDILPPALDKVHQINTMEFVRDYQARSARKSLFFPDIDMYAVYSKDLTPADFPSVITMSRAQLTLLDTQYKFRVTPKPQTEKEVFISFSSQDENVANAITDTLAAHGISAWNFRRNMGGGHYPEQIVRAIRSASVFVVIISKHALQSVDVMSEVNLAYRRVSEGLVIMPFLVDDTPMSDNFQYYLGAHNCYDGKRPPLEERVRDFAENIRNVLRS